MSLRSQLAGMCCGWTHNAPPVTSVHCQSGCCWGGYVHQWLRDKIKTHPWRAEAQQLHAEPVHAFNSCMGGECFSAWGATFPSVVGGARGHIFTSHLKQYSGSVELDLSWPSWAKLGRWVGLPTWQSPNITALGKNEWQNNGVG